MIDSAQQQLEFFIQATKILFLDIERWTNKLNLDCKLSPISITEEACGTYSIDKLVIQSKQGGKIVEVIPIAAFVLGANGRIDINGIFDSITIIHLNKGGPSMTQTHHDEDDKPYITRIHYFYRGIEESGWYWIENKVSRKGHRIGEEVFVDILMDISDYEYSRYA